MEDKDDCAHDGKKKCTKCAKKRCSKCKAWKEVGEFAKRNDHKNGNGRVSHCKDCKKAAANRLVSILGPHHNDYTNVRFHYFIGVRYLGQMVNGSALWEWRCLFNNCGNLKAIVARNVVHGDHTKSCGCYRMAMLQTPRALKHLRTVQAIGVANIKARAQAQLRRDVPNIGDYWTDEQVQLYGSAFSRLHSTWKNGATARGSGQRKRQNGEYTQLWNGPCWTLTKQQAFEKCQGPCWYCNAPPVIMGNKEKCLRNGIDRIDSRRGYTPENTVPCCWSCNEDKGFMTQKAFYDQTRRRAAMLPENQRKATDKAA